MINQCKFLIKRLNGALRCKKIKQDIGINYCNMCQDKEYKIKTNKPIKNKTSKLQKLEKNRYSIFTNDLEHCYYHMQFNCVVLADDIHEVFGGSNRQRSMKNGLCVPLCRKCHDDNLIIQVLRNDLQKEFEKNHTRKEFIEIIGWSYL